MRKDNGGNRREVFTLTDQVFRVKCDVMLYDLKEALALRAIISSFEASAERDRRKNVKGLVSSTLL